MGAFLASACQPATPASTGSTATTARTGATTEPAGVAQPGGTALPRGYPVTVSATGGPPPDFPSTGAWIDNGYVNYPANPVKLFSASEAPGRGGEVSWFARMNYSVAPTPLEQNPTWQETNRQLNATIKLTQVSGTDYPVKLATLMAGNDIPDIIYLLLGRGTVPRMSEFLQAQCADLTPSGWRRDQAVPQPGWPTHLRLAELGGGDRRQGVHAADPAVSRRPDHV
jgi:putative aldouronate transport system substrate-binding protein